MDLLTRFLECKHSCFDIQRMACEYLQGFCPVVHGGLQVSVNILALNGICPDLPEL